MPLTLFVVGSGTDHHKPPAVVAGDASQSTEEYNTNCFSDMKAVARVYSDTPAADALDRLVVASDEIREEFVSLLTEVYRIGLEHGEEKGKASA